jgi:beta-phosphoglucomutase family hydrolase
MYPEGLIFDFDGTLADTMPLHWIAWSKLRDHHGFQLTRERLYSMGGIPSRDIVAILNQEQGRNLDPLALAKEKEGTYLSLLDQVEPINAILNIARTQHEKIPLAVASGGTRRVIETVMDHLKIRPLFQVIVTSEDVIRQKPAPDIFLEAARRLGVEPAKCRAFEDTDIGLAAIRSAGMEAIDVRQILGNDVKN